MVSDRRPDDMVRITTPELADEFIEEQIFALREQIGDKTEFYPNPLDPDIQSRGIGPK